MLPKLENVGGAMNVQTSSEFDCSQIEDLGDNQIVKGEITCAGSQSTPGGAGSTPTSSGSSPTRTNAAVNLGINVPAVMGGTSVVAALLHLLL